jgi:hypothetical protein
LDFLATVWSHIPSTGGDALMRDYKGGLLYFFSSYLAGIQQILPRYHRKQFKYYVHPWKRNHKIIIKIYKEKNSQDDHLHVLGKESTTQDH